MNSSIIGKMDKARRYAQEPHRIAFNQFNAQFQGEHDTYDLAYKDEHWHCSCNFFAHWNVCSHSMALQRLLAGMLPKDTLPHEISLEPALPQGR